MYALQGLEEPLSVSLSKPSTKLIKIIKYYFL
jgi:hypothetical protein